MIKEILLIAFGWIITIIVGIIGATLFWIVPNIIVKIL